MACLCGVRECPSVHDYTVESHAAGMRNVVRVSREASSVSSPWRWSSPIHGSRKWRTGPVVTKERRSRKKDV